jgi:hypothetical protein
MAKLNDDWREPETDVVLNELKSVLDHAVAIADPSWSPERDDFGNETHARYIRTRGGFTYVVSLKRVR